MKEVCLCDSKVMFIMLSARVSERSRDLKTVSLLVSGFCELFATKIIQA